VQGEEGQQALGRERERERGAVVLQRERPHQSDERSVCLKHLAATVRTMCGR
jgi:hypothetical protein